MTTANISHFGAGAKLQDNRFPADGQKVSLGSLPEDLNAAIQAALGEARTRAKDAKSAGVP